MSKSLLITNPDYDPCTRYLHKWSKEILEEAEKRGIDVVKLEKNKVTKKEFEGRMKKVKPSLVVIHGHGNNNCVCGHEHEVLIEAGVNDNILANKIVYALSCRSAAGLGVISVKNGARSYIGYIKDFAFGSDYNKFSHPENDNLAKLFLEPSNQVSISLIKGNTAGEASRKSKIKFLKNIQKLLHSESSEYPTARIIPLLFSNMKHQVCLGDASATF